MFASASMPKGLRYRFITDVLFLCREVLLFSKWSKMLWLLSAPVWFWFIFLRALLRKIRLGSIKLGSISPAGLTIGSDKRGTFPYTAFFFAANLLARSSDVYDSLGLSESATDFYLGDTLGLLSFSLGRWIPWWVFFWEWVGLPLLPRFIAITGLLLVINWLLY